DVEMNLQLPIDETESEAQSPSSSKEGARSTEGIAGYHRAQAKHVPPASCSAESSTDKRRHGSWAIDPCPGLAESGPASALSGATMPRAKEDDQEDRHLQQVTLIWERGSESRFARTPVYRRSGQRKTWRPLQSWPPLLVHMVRQRHSSGSAQNLSSGEADPG
ncbi:unnamed protein product, partial [Polarella glacialis]